MLRVDFESVLSPGSRVLCLGAHCDDIDIGCGATLIKLQERVPDLHVDWVVMTGNDTREGETRACAKRLQVPGSHWSVQVERFRNGFFPSEFAALKQFMETLKDRSPPDLILTHFGGDHHQDHRVVSELTWNTFRDHWVLEYEIPKYDGDLGNPQVFVEVSEAQLDVKVEALLDCYASQRDKAWFDRETFRSLPRLRGVQCQTPYAEAFYVRKMLF